MTRAAIASNCLTRLETSDGSTPLPAAIRRRREMSIRCGFFALGRGHAVDDPLDALDLAVGVDVVEARRGIWFRPGILPISSLTEPIFFICDDLLAEVVEVELPLGQLLLLPLRLLLVDRRLRGLDQADDVAHAEHLADDPLGVERLELVELLALADELDRHAGHLA